MRLGRPPPTPPFPLPPPSSPYSGSQTPYPPPLPPCHLHLLPRGPPSCPPSSPLPSPPPHAPHTHTPPEGEGHPVKGVTMKKNRSGNNLRRAWPSSELGERPLEHNLSRSEKDIRVQKQHLPPPPPPQFSPSPPSYRAPGECDTPTPSHPHPPTKLHSFFFFFFFFTCAGLLGVGAKGMARGPFF